MPAGDKAMLTKIVLAAFIAFTLTCAKAENIVCPPQNDIVANFDKWSADYSGSLNEVWLSRQFLDGQEGATIRCSRTIGSVQIMFQKRSCRIIPGTGKVQITPYGNAEDTDCSLSLPHPLTNDKACIVVCK
jgi:hypothetical protein